MVKMCERCNSYRGPNVQCGCGHMPLRGGCIQRNSWTREDLNLVEWWSGKVMTTHHEHPWKPDETLCGRHFSRAKHGVHDSFEEDADCNSCLRILKQLQEW